jgi:hypothetical protein
MRRLLIGSSLVIALALGGTAMAQESNANVLGTIKEGNTTIVFEQASSRDLPIKQYQDWEEFAQNHPGIVVQLRHHPALVRSDAWVRKHQALDNFFNEHPELRETMERNPGNFVAPTTPTNS